MLINSFFPHSIQIAKFGGTSLADFSSMNRSIDIVLSNSNIKLVILSASSRVTDLLILLSKEKKNKNQDLYIQKIEDIQYAIIDHLHKKEKIHKKIKNIINRIIFLVKSNLVFDSPQFTDELISYGEIMSTMLFVEILHQRKIYAKWFDIRQVIYTNDEFGCAKPNEKIIKIRSKKFILPLLKNNIVVTQGFIGSEKNGRTTTLGRGSSNYTATLLGEALKVKRIEIWTDVSGIYTVDPNICSIAKRIEKISFQEAINMASFGAKILHPRMLLPALRENISIFFGSSKNPKSGGTIVCSYNKKLPYFRSMILKKNQLLIILNRTNIPCTIEFLSKIFNFLLKYKISVDLITFSKRNIFLIVDLSELSDLNESISLKSFLLGIHSFYQVKIKKNLSLVIIIGNSFSKKTVKKNIVLKILKNFNIKWSFFGVKNHNFYFLVSSKYAKSVVYAIHKKLFV